jgi:carbamoyl-phosphate synthase large subunit
MSIPRQLQRSLKLRHDGFSVIQAMEKLGLAMAVSKTANTLEEAREIATNIIGGFPIVIRPAFTLGGTGGGIAYNQQEFEDIVKNGLDASMTSQVCLCRICAAVYFIVAA